MKELYISFIVCIIIISNAHSQSVHFEKKIDSLFKNQFTQKTPGCAVSISIKGQVVYEKAFGSANLELDVPLKPESVFSLASITKQFTAVSILQLVSQGKIQLTDQIQKYIPDFPTQNILVENLLSHTSGLKDYLQIDNGQKFGERWDYTPFELINIFKDLPLEFEPGTKYKYCNSDYIILGYIIEKASGKKYQEYLEENIFMPLKMKQTYFDSDEIIIPNRASGYFKDGEIYKNAEYWSSTIGYSAGGLISSVIDLQKWQQGLTSYKVLSKEWLDVAFTPYILKDGTKLDYGFGWNVTSINNIKCIYHSGAKNGFRTYESYFPEKQLYVVLLFNSEETVNDALSIKVSEILLGKSLQTSITLTDKTIQSYIGIYNLVSDPKRTITIEKRQSGLIANISGQGSYQLLFQTQTEFQLKNLLDIKCEFRIVNGKVESIIANQHGSFEWRKIK